MASLQERMIGAMKGDVKTFQEIEADPIGHRAGGHGNRDRVAGLR